MIKFRKYKLPQTGEIPMAHQSLDVPRKEEHLVLVKLTDDSELHVMLKSCSDEELVYRVWSWDYRFFILDPMTGYCSKKQGGFDISNQVVGFCEDGNSTLFKILVNMEGEK